MAAVVTETGRGITTNRLKNATGTEPNYIAWGTGAGTAVVTNTALFTESAETRIAGTSTLVTTNSTNDTYQVVGTMTCAGAGKTITNAGLFDAVSAGNLYMLGDFTGIPLSIGDSIQFTMKVQHQ